MQKGIKAGVVAERKLRMVTHYGIEDDEISFALVAIKEIIENPVEE
jgi:Cys-tRNA synthase (O-phospho-L-seryl-tRNA:Cys-tRNA synthase)